MRAFTETKAAPSLKIHRKLLLIVDFTQGLRGYLKPKLSSDAMLYYVDSSLGTTLIFLLRYHQEASALKRRPSIGTPWPRSEACL
jgi:hypothetical protein